MRIRNPGCGIWIRMDPRWFWLSGSGSWKWPTEIEISEDISCFEVPDVLFCGLGASPCSWDVLHESLRMNKLQFWSKKLVLFISKIFHLWSSIETYVWTDFTWNIDFKSKLFFSVVLYWISLSITLAKVYCHISELTSLVWKDAGF